MICSGFRSLLLTYLWRILSSLLVKVDIYILVNISYSVVERALMILHDGLLEFIINVDILHS